MLESTRMPRDGDAGCLMLGECEREGKGFYLLSNKFTPPAWFIHGVNYDARRVVSTSLASSASRALHFAGSP